MLNNKILIIDDDKLVRESISAYLMIEKYEVSLASNGKDGLDLLMKVKPILVILDIMMADMDGIQFLDNIKLSPDDSFSIIMVSGYSNSKFFKTCFDLGISAFLTKPFTPSELIGLVRNTIILKETQMRLQEEIKERKRIENSLEKSESEYRSLVDTIPDIVYKIDSNGYFIFLNNSVKSLGYKPEELIGEHFSTILEEIDVKAVSREMILREYSGKTTEDNNAPKLFDERRTGKGITINLEVRLVPKCYRGYKKSDSRFVGKINSFRIGEVVSTGCYNNGEKRNIENFKGTLGIIRDITEKVKLQSNSIREGQLAILGELAGCVAHEINNPINTIINLGQLLLDDSSLREINRKDINLIIEESKRIEDIIKTLLTYAVDRGNEKGLFKLNDIVNDVIKLTNKQICNANVDLVLNIPDELPKIFIQSQQLQHVFLNLISNSLYSLNEKFPNTDDNKIIDISANEINIDGGRYVEIIFEDQGMGIAQHHIDRITDPFYTTKPEGKGTGFGLNICDSIIKRFKGSMRIESIEGEFTKVLICLPV